jgi:hypothetical protein
MKRSIVNLIVSLFLLLVLFGCEDNSINSPVSNEKVNKADPLGINNLEGTIILDQKLIDPINVNNYYLLKGKINFSRELTFIQSSMAVTPIYEVRLDIYVDATLRDYLSNLEPNTWNIKSESHDRFNLNENGNYTLVKTYPIDGMPDMIELDCTFSVTTEGIKLDEVFLRSPVV